MKKVNLNNYILYISFSIMCFSVFFLRWYINSSLVVYMACFSTIYIYILTKEYNKISIKDMCIFLIFLLYICINLLLTNKHTYFFDDLIYNTFLPMTILLFFTIHFKNEFKSQKFLSIFLYLINIYYIINNYIVLKQINTNGFMIRNFSKNTFYLDQISGLFGTNGTHKLCLFFIISLYTNILFFKNKNKFTNIFSKIMFVYILITSIYVSSYNDNRIYLILLVLFLLPFLYDNFNMNSLKFKKKLLSIITITSICIITLIVLYNTNETFKTFIYNDIYEKYIVKTFNQFNNVNSSLNTKGEERIELTIYALKNGNGYLFGKGIGSIITYSDPNLPRHFGLNESTLRIYTGGIIYLLLLSYIYYYNFNKIINKNNLILKIYLFITILFLALYSRVFTSFDETFLMTLMYMLIIIYTENNNNFNKNIRKKEKSKVLFQ